MHSTRRFEGPDLDEVLSEVRATLGSGAAILEANRLRRGGVAGFFAKERYEVVVDLDASTDEEALEEAAEAAAAAPLSLLDLVEAVSDGDGDGHGRAAASGAAPAAPPAPSISTEGDPFNAVLQRMAADAGIELDLAGSAPAPAPAPQDLAAPAADVGADLDLDPDIDLDLTRGPSAPSEAGLDRYRQAGDLHPVVPAPAVPAPAAAAVDRPARRRGSIDRAARDEPQGGRSVAMAGLGLPATCIPDDAVVDLTSALCHLLEGLPVAPPVPDLPGAVIAVVGDRTDALALATSLAAELGLDAGSVVLASRSSWDGDIPAENRIPDVAGAAERRLSWRRRRTSTVVAVEAPPLRSGAAWASDVLDALEPTAVWATVPATRKAEDLEAWAGVLGGLDALALTQLDATVSPASALQAGIPVARLCGATATPARWASLLVDRLEPAGARS